MSNIEFAHEVTPRIKSPLTRADRCDSCSAAAQVRVTLSRGELLFCRHHYNKNAQALEEMQVEFYGED